MSAEKAKKLRGIEDLQIFLNFLSARGIKHRVAHLRDDCLTVGFATGGVMIEVDFFDDGVEYAYFQEEQGVDGKRVLELIDEGWS